MNKITLLDRQLSLMPTPPVQLLTVSQTFE
jgi:hypothetical protein